MKKNAERFPYLPLLISGIAIILFSTAGFARMMGWVALDEAFPAPVPTESAARARPMCPECGVIVATGGNELIVRMADGSGRVIHDANPARWRAGERVMVIAGTDSPPP